MKTILIAATFMGMAINTAAAPRQLVVSTPLETSSLGSVVASIAAESKASIVSAVESKVDLLTQNRPDIADADWNIKRDAMPDPRVCNSANNFCSRRPIGHYPHVSHEPKYAAPGAPAIAPSEHHENSKREPNPFSHLYRPLKDLCNKKYFILPRPHCVSPSLSRTRNSLLANATYHTHDKTHVKSSSKIFQQGIGLLDPPGRTTTIEDIALVSSMPAIEHPTQTTAAPAAVAETTKKPQWTGGETLVTRANPTATLGERWTGEKTLMTRATPAPRLQPRVERFWEKPWTGPPLQFEEVQGSGLVG